MSSVLAVKKKKVIAKWDTVVERNLIDIWVDILYQYNGDNKKEKRSHSNHSVKLVYCEELDREDKYIENEVCNKIECT